MTSSIGLLAVFADVLILLTLAAAVRSPRASHLVRVLITTFAFTCAWLLTAVADALRAPGWTMFTGGAVLVVSIVVITVTVHLWAQEGGNETGSGQRGDKDGGGPPRRKPDAPQHGGGGRDPSWWPEFEREVALYVAERERERHETDVLPAEPAPHAGWLSGGFSPRGCRETAGRRWPVLEHRSRWTGLGLVTRHNDAQCRHTIWIECRAALVLEQRESALSRPRRSIDPVCRQRVIYVRDGEDANGDVKLPGGNTVGVATPVETLVMTLHQVENERRESTEFGQELAAVAGMAPDLGELGVGQRPGLVQDRVGDRQLADVVQQTAERELT